MLFIKRFLKLFAGVFLVLAISVTGLSAMTAYADQSDSLYLGGFPAGFLLNTQTVEVIGTCEVFTEDGPHCPARESGIKCGDKIRKLNGEDITSADQLTNALSEKLTVYNLTIERGGETYEIPVKPIIDKATGKKRLGLLVKDSLNGIGTVTYIDKQNNKFGSLGHPVTDTNGNLMKINGGKMFGCAIYDVKKGLRGNPGELKGIFNNTENLGDIRLNSKCGIFGDLPQDYDVTNLKCVKRGSVKDAQMGTAYIYSTLNGNQCEEYEISIVKVDATNKDNRNYVIKVNDPKLLEQAGGIVQGMSGSPIVQNGKLIGAVTHVFVNDPTRGYGIALEHMTNSY